MATVTLEKAQRWYPGEVTSGKRFIGDRDLITTPPKDRDIAMVCGRGPTRKGEVLHVTTDPGHLHVFDSDTRERLSG